MLHFDCDYMEGACPEVMRRLAETNMEQTPGYGTDRYTKEAVELIRQACAQPEAEVHFLVGGTQTNATVIDGLLRRHEGVLAAETAHINVHEAGAIEACGHKVLVLPQHDGKLRAADVERYTTDFYRDETYEHMVAPGMVYISHPTELGTLYTRAELEELSQTCHRLHLPLYLDGARLAYGLVAANADLTLPDVARLCDAFYIGGTKTGALFGEAVVARRGLLPRLAGHEAETRLPVRRLPLPHRLAHQPAVLLPAQRNHRQTEHQSHLRDMGHTGRERVCDTFRHQLGHPARSGRRAAFLFGMKLNEVGKRHFFPTFFLPHETYSYLCREPNLMT